MHLVQLLLPLNAPDGTEFPRERFAEVAAELTERHGGMTAYTRSPAEGRWNAPEAGEVHDEVVVFEVMVETLDRAAWAEYRRDLERRFDQDELVIRALAIERL